MPIISSQFTTKNSWTS